MTPLEKLLKENRSKQNTLLTQVKNGRVDIMGNQASSSNFPLFEETKRGNKLYVKEALKSIMHVTPLHMYFFSERNINTLWDIIRYNVWIQSGKKHVVGRQSDDELKIVMRSIYLQSAKHQNSRMKQQIQELNQSVCNYCISNILSNVEQYLGYKKHVSTLPEPLPLPVNLSSTGSKKLQNMIGGNGGDRRFPMPL